MALAHHSLVAWQRADDLFIRVHRLSIEHFPSYERYELGQQLRRAAYSVVANIVEGFATPAGRRRVNFLNIAASLAEVGYCVHAAQRIGYITGEISADVDNDIKRVGAPLSGLVRSERLHTGATAVALLLMIVIGIAWR